MARSSSRSSSAKPVSRPSAAPARAPAPAHHASPPPPARGAAPPAPTPAAHPPAPAPAPSSGGGGMLSGLGATVAQGFAFGAGSAVARHAVDSVFNSFSGDKKEAAPAPVAPQVQQPPVQQYNGPCAADNYAFNRCLQENPTNSAMCDQYFNALQACQSRI
mmetsp:Transcript_5289/g.5787  ORF Transcript_5289/g.5787 Transcript_5289/m.5787 type:complete len:161 (+) Transcript_5289:94-576(+)